MIGVLKKLVFITLAAIGLISDQALADPVITVDQSALYAASIAPGGFWEATVTITNNGDAPLTVTKIGTSETSPGPGGWLSTSADELYVPAGPENTLDLEIYIDASDYQVLAPLAGSVYLLSNASNTDSLTIMIAGLILDDSYLVRWDTLGTDDVFNWPLSSPPGATCLGLSVSTHGAIGLPGWTGANLDYYLSGLECGTREADERYLVSGSPFVLINDGDEYSLTVSNYQAGQAKAHHWLPTEIPDFIQGGWVGGYGSYEWRQTPPLVSADGHIGMQRTFYAPQSPEGHTGYIIVRTMVYAADGLPHDGLTIGSVIDWDVPSDVPVMNTSGTAGVGSSPRPCTYMRGTDTVGSQACQENAGRFGAECLYGAGYWEWGGWAGPLNDAPWGAFAAPAALMRDTSLTRDGLPLSPAQPDPEAWWEEIAAHPGFHADAQPGNQAIWTVFAHDIDIAADNTLVFYSVLTSVRSGTVSDVGRRISAAMLFDAMKFGPCCACCVGKVGDVNGSGEDEPTIGDVTALISFLFLAEGWAIPCMDEADITQNGGCCSNTEDVTIADISLLLDYLFITGPENMVLPPCAW